MSFPHSIMSDKHNTEIIQYLLSHKKEEFTIRSIAKETAIEYKAAYTTIQQLIEDDIIQAKKAGQATLCSINHKSFNASIFKAEEARTGTILKNKNIAIMYSYFKDIKGPFFILLLFGSYAKGIQRKKSDIDLLLITDQEEIKKDIMRNIKLMPLDIHLSTFTAKEFLSMLKTTEFNVGKEAFFNNVILFGIDDYYRLIQNA
jgi:predicted nucleotidyltransferase/predicted transcriptional regulator